MRSALLSITALLAGIGFLMLGNGLLGTLLGLRLTMAEATPLVTSLVMASYFVGLVAGSLTTHHAISLAGHIRAFSAFASIFSAATLAHALIEAPLPWALLRVIEGYTMSGLFMCAESWLNARATNENRGQVLSVYMVVIYLAQGSGQFFFMAAGPEGYLLFAVASILASLSLVPVAMTRFEAPPPPEPAGFSLRKLAAMSPLGVWGSLASGMVMGAFYGLGPMFAALNQLTINEVAHFMSAAIFGGLLLQWPIGWLADRIERRRLIALLGLILALVCLAIVAVSGRGYVLLLVFGSVFGGVAAVLYPLAVAHANDVIKSTDIVHATGGLLLAYGIGAAIGAPVASVAMARLGGDGLFIFVVVVSALLTAFAFWRSTRSDPVSEEDREAFHVLPRTTALAAEMDPRADHDDGQLSFDFDAPAPGWEQELSRAAE